LNAEIRHDPVYQAIAHHTRREILTLLRTGPRPVTEIVRAFSVSQPAVSRQLRVLLDASLVTAETAGRQRIYRLNVHRLGVVREWVERTIEDPAGHVWVLRGKPKTKKGS
jgi:DNA-binding transcriptional ArsR family regulator